MFQPPASARTVFTIFTGKNIVSVLLCPSEITNSPATIANSNPTNLADASPRSYFINGWNDYFADTLGADRLFTNPVRQPDHLSERHEGKRHPSSQRYDPARGKIFTTRRFLNGFEGGKRR